MGRQPEGKERQVPVGRPCAIFFQLLALVLCDAAPAMASSNEFERYYWFKSLEVPWASPFAGQSCCDVADGYPVEAEARADGFWYVRLLDRGRRLPPDWVGRWIQVPPPIVLATNSIDEWGYLFIYRNELRCFVPPLRGT